jgi:hypothetical protein
MLLTSSGESHAFNLFSCCGEAPMQAGNEAGIDTISVGERGRLWSMDELKEVLSEESKGGTAGTSWQRNKNPRIAMLCALLFPGLGQLYNERTVKTALALGIETLYLSQILQNYRNAKRKEKLRDRSLYGTSQWREYDWWVGEYKERTIDWAWWSAGTLVVIILDAYIDAHLHDLKFKIEGRADEACAGVSFVIEF